MPVPPRVPWASGSDRTPHRVGGSISRAHTQLGTYGARPVSAEQPRLPLSYYEQQIPVPGGWNNRPCGYLLFGPPYDRMAQEARERDWDVEQVPGRHLHQLVDPDTVAARIVAMTGRWRFLAD